MEVLIIFGTRPEAIKMAPVVRAMEKHRDEIQPIVCVTAQHREMLDQVLPVFDIRPAIDLNLMEENQSLAAITARAIERLTQVLVQTRPDCVLVQGDTTTAMAAAMAAFYQKIPVGHVEAGLRTQSRYSPFPEEINRRLISVLSTYHFAPTLGAASALLAEGVSQEAIFVTGNTVIDAMLWTVSQPPSLQTQQLLSGLGVWPTGRLQGGGVPKPRLILVTAHRRENFGRPLENICLALKEIARLHPDVEIFYPVHRNPNVRGPVYGLLSRQPRIHLVDPLPYESFVHVMNASHLVLTDSGGIQEEAPALGKPVLVLREDTERPEAVEAGTAKVVGVELENIVREADRLLSQEAEYCRMAQAVSPYGVGHAAEQIVSILLSLSRQGFSRVGTGCRNLQEL